MSGGAPWSIAVTFIPSRSKSNSQKFLSWILTRADPPALLFLPPGVQPLPRGGAGCVGEGEGPRGEGAAASFSIPGFASETRGVELFSMDIRILLDMPLARMASMSP